MKLINKNRIKKKYLYFYHPSSNRMENGNIIDNLSAIIVMVFVFAVLYAFISYGKCVMIKLKADNITKEYLYKMEEWGYLRAEDEKALKDALTEAGFTNISINTNVPIGKQVAYGDKVELTITVSVRNPVYEVLGAEPRGGEFTLDKNGYPTNAGGTMFTKAGLSPIITFSITMSSTSKW